MNDETISVLVVDDELGMREGCRKILSEEGYIVDAAPDGVAGLEMFKAHRGYAIALVDLNMPRMGGMELIKHMRELDENVVIFVITAYASINTAVEATRRGAYGYIPKPFTPDELLLPVRNGLERRALSMEAQRLRAEREGRLLEVARERSKSSTIISCMTDGVLVVNRDKQVVLHNDAMIRILPSCAALPLSAPMVQLDCRELTEIIDEVLSAGPGPVIASKEMGCGKCTYMVNASSVVEPDGGVMGAVVVMRDITALKKLDVAKSMFVSMVAHELKSPLAAVESKLNLILKGFIADDPDKERENIERCLLRINALRTMVSDLLNLTAIETGKFTIKRTALNVREVLHAALDACRDRAEEKQMALLVSCAPGIENARILADRDSLFMVFTNLIDNAVKYTPEGGHVEVSIESNGVFVKVAVRDDGIGMTAEEADSVFEEFYRAKNDYTIQVPGTGLGLSLVKKLLEMHQGTITVHSTPGEGSTFTVSLPIHE